MLHELPLERRTLHGHFSRDLEPVLTVDPGDSIRCATLNARWHWDRRQPFVDDPGPGHALSGPIAVRGCRAGQTLVVRVDEVAPRPWGATYVHGQPLCWTLDGDVWVDDHGRRVAAAPFLGVIGMPPPEPGTHSTRPPRRWGGNIDCKLLVSGTTLYLPVPVDGGLVSLGDGHGAQGDGEVSGTAIECPLERTEVTLDVWDGPELRMPVARTADAWLAFGFDDDLDRAAELATETMLDLMERELGVDRSHALALASVAVDLRVTQVVNEAKGIHAVLRDGAIR